MRDEENQEQQFESLLSLTQPATSSLDGQSADILKINVDMLLVSGWELSEDKDHRVTPWIDCEFLHTVVANTRFRSSCNIGPCAALCQLQSSNVSNQTVASTNQF